MRRIQQPLVSLESLGRQRWRFAWRPRSAAPAQRLGRPALGAVQLLSSVISFIGLHDEPSNASKAGFSSAHLVICRGAQRLSIASQGLSSLSISLTSRAPEPLPTSRPCNRKSLPRSAPLCLLSSAISFISFSSASKSSGSQRWRRSGL